MKKLFQLDKKVLLKELLFLALSFIIPFVMLIIIMQVNNISLFNYSNNTVIMIDLQSQYVAYMSNYKYLLEHGGSFIYTSSKVFGGDYLSIFDFYLASPFNLLVVFFSYEAIPLFFVWTAILKMCFASMNMYLLTRLASRFTYSKIIPAIGYGLISYSFVYLHNFMWLDGVMILPLVILGLIYIKDNKHHWLYVLAFAYAFITSWYIGFMIAIFTGLYFLVEFLSNFSYKNKANYLFLLRFAVFTGVSLLISSMWWFTAFIHLGGTKGTIQLPHFETFSISMLLGGFLENNYETVSLITQNNSYLTSFVGMVPLVFFITYFFNGKFTLKERLITFALVAFYLFASCTNTLSALLHGGREPTWFPTRYSFILGFIVCYLASKSLDEIDSFNPVYYAAPIVVFIAGLLTLKFVKHSERLEYYTISVISMVIYLSTIIISVGYSVLNHYSYKNKTVLTIKKFSPLLFIPLFALQVLSSYRGADNIFKVNTTAHQFQKYETYLKDINYMPSFDAVKEYEVKNDNSPFYRMEATFNREGNYNQVNNNPLLYSYNGFSHFSSTSKQEVDRYNAYIGFHHNSYFAKYDGGSTFAINSLYGVKYLLEDKSNYLNIHPYFLDYDTFTKIDVSDVDCYYNPYATTLSFISDKSDSTFINEGERITDDYVYWYDKYEYQNILFRTLNNDLDKDIFYPLNVDSINTSLEYEEDIMGIRTYKNIKRGDSITMEISVPTEAYKYPLYFSEREKTGDISYYMDGRSMEVNNYWHNGIRSFKDTVNHKHTLRIVFQKDFDSLKLRPELAYENVDITKEYMSIVKANEMKVTSKYSKLFSSGYTGTLKINTQVRKDLVFTLPIEDNIHVKVDGKEVETYKRYNVLTAIDISTLSVGEHEITIYYLDHGFRGGFIMGVVGISIFVPLVIFYVPLEKKIFYRKKED